MFLALDLLHAKSSTDRAATETGKFSPQLQNYVSRSLIIKKYDAVSFIIHYETIFLSFVPGHFT